VYALTAGAITLLGWATGVRLLTDWLSVGISMFPNTAMCAVLSGLALMLYTMGRRRWRPLQITCALAVAAVGGLTLCEHLSGINFGLDTLLFEGNWGQAAAASPMRMGPPASTAFLLAGAALVLLNRGLSARRTSAIFAIVVVTIPMLSLIGYLYGAAQMYTIPSLTGISLQTASVLLLLGAGLVASTPECEPMRSALDQGAGGLLVRRAFPLVVLAAIALGWLRVWLQNAGLVDTAVGTASRTLVEIALLALLLWWAAATVRLHEWALRDSEAKVRRQAAQLSALLETAAVGMHRVGPDGTILWVNDAELDMLGYTRDEYVGHPIAEFHADRGVIADILARLHRGEKLLEHPAQMRCKDGSLKSVLIDSSVLWDEGRFIHTQCFTRDVTDRKRAAETHELLAAIVEASDDAVVSKTLDGVITSWNGGAERIFGYSAAEAVGRGIELIIPPDRLGEERDILARLRRGERIEHFETLRRAKDGRLMDISLTISPVRDATGRVVGASKIARDITDRKRAELERDENNRRKDEFIAILAHELRNPLAPVRNAARYLKLKAPPQPDLQRAVDMVERQVAQMSRLIDDLLDVSRISRGMLELRRERVSCEEVVEAAIDVCRDDINAKGHRLQVSMPSAAIELEADRERLVQILSNLIGNATKYTPAGGDIAVTVGAAEHVLRVSVRDNGIGIPPEKLTEIFDLFARVDRTFDRQDGLGIGLTLVRQLVELHGGAIQARSAGVGHGSEFVLELPIVASTPVRAVAPQDTEPVSAPLRVLVADDNADAAESLALLLEVAGHEVHVAYDGEAAIETAARTSPQVALLDIGMPKANGYDVARHLREQAWGRKIYLVALTGWGQESDRDRARDAGFDAHLVKPVPLEMLDQLLATVSSSNGSASVSAAAPAPIDTIAKERVAKS
jgi:PAS domain S-box-containing protein